MVKTYEEWKAEQNQTVEVSQEATDTSTGDSIPSFEDWQNNKPADKPKSVDEIIATSSDQTLWEKLTSPTAPQEFNWGNVATSAGVGAGAGLVLPIGGPIIGGGYGLISGVAGEIARTQGASPLTTFGVEAFSTTPIPLLKTVALKSLGILSWKGQKISNLLKTTKDEATALYRAKETTFGKDSIEGMYTTQNSDRVQAAIKSKLASQGLKDIPENMKASDIMRKQLFEDIDNMVDVQPFTKSAAFKDLVADIDVLFQRGFINKNELKNLNKTLMTQLSTNPDVKAKSSKDLLDLIQNGGLFVEKGVTQTKIPKKAQEALRIRFNEYLETNLGRRGYDNLKRVEQMEFVAEARDSIPLLLDSQFKGLTSEVQNSLVNIAKSPRGKADFLDALKQHFKNFDKSTEANPDKLMAEFHRLRPILEKSGLATRDELVDLSTKIKGLPEQVSKEKRFNTISDMVDALLIGAGGNIIKETTPEIQEVFSL